MRPNLGLSWPLTGGPTRTRHTKSTLKAKEFKDTQNLAIQRQQTISNLSETMRPKTWYLPFCFAVLAYLQTTIQRTECLTRTVALQHVSKDGHQTVLTDHTTT